MLPHLRRAVQHITPYKHRVLRFFSAGVALHAHAADFGFASPFSRFTLLLVRLPHARFACNMYTSMLHVTGYCAPRLLALRWCATLPFPFVGRIAPTSPA